MTDVGGNEEGGMVDLGVRDSIDGGREIMDGVELRLGLDGKGEFIR